MDKVSAMARSLVERNPTARACVCMCVCVWVGVCVSQIVIKSNDNLQHLHLIGTTVRLKTKRR